MNLMPQHQHHIQPAFQAGADALIAIIETERSNAAAASREQFQRLELLFHTYQQQAESVHAADQVKLRQIYQQLLQVRDRIAHLQQESAQLAQLRGTEASATVALRDDRENLRADIIRVNMEALEAQRAEALASRQFEELRSVLQKVGIAFSSADNSLQFSASWAFVLAELDTQGRGPTNPEELHELLGRLTQRLQSDRDKIVALERKILSSEQERQKIVEKSEMEIASLRLEVSTVHDPARFQSSSMPSRSPQRQYADKQSNTRPHNGATLIVPSTQITHPTPQTLAAWNKSGRPMPQMIHALDTIAQAPRHEGSSEMSLGLPSPPLHEHAMLQIPRIDLRLVQADGRRKTHKSTTRA